ncbi:MAG: hypothetical protein ABFR63_05175 [Thermodesulfobacteriota bacterium]
MMKITVLSNTYIRQRPVITCTSLFILLILITFPHGAEAAYEKPATLSAKEILAPELFKGSYHTVANQVKNNGLFNHYRVESQFGIFQAGSTSELVILVHEFEAIAAMRKVASDDTAMEGLKQSGGKTVAGLTNLFHDPEASMEGAVAGVGSLFNRVKETVGKREATEAEDSRLEQLVGISKSKGKIATQYGVNVYSRNPVLQTELDRLGQADFLGGLGVGLATSFVPGVGGLVLSVSGTARLLNEAINTTPASELWRQNKRKLLAMWVHEDTAELFLNNPSFSPAQSTVLVAALESMKGVENRELFVKVALQAADPAMADIITVIAVMSASYHKEIAPLQGFSPMARLTQGIRRDGTRVVLLPTDHIIWDRRVADAATAVSDQAKGKGMELWLFGSLSKQATTELERQGWKIHTEAGPRLMPQRK